MQPSNIFNEDSVQILSELYQNQFHIRSNCLIKVLIAKIFL
jgi:hypothetical protein